MWASPEIQVRLRRTAGREAFCEELLRVAGELGVEISRPELEQRLTAAQQAWMLRWLEG